MQKEYRLRKNYQFQYVYRRGKSAACKELVLIYVKGNTVKVGFSVSNKLGCAVVRNRVKRKLRACIRPIVNKIKNGSYIILARNASVEADFAKLNKQIMYLLKKQNLFKENK